MFLFSVTNFLFFDKVVIAVIEFFVLLLSLLLLYLLRKPENYNYIVFFTVFTTGVLLIWITLFTKSESSTLVWISTFSIVSFYLLGIKVGLIALITFSVIYCLLLYTGFYNITYVVTNKTILNTAALLTVHGILIYYYEYTRNEAIHHMHMISLTDNLTHVGNRKMFNLIAKREISLSTRYKTPLSVIMLDIDYFKKINDEFGHHTGDKVLIELSDTIKNNIRATDALMRWGGEEFIILLPNTNKENAFIMTEKLRKMIENKSFSGIKNITSSFGVTTLAKNENLETFFKRVDHALYQAKEAGRNKVISS